MTTTRYEQPAALVAEKKTRIEPLIAEIRTLPPFPAPASSVRATLTPIPSSSPAAWRKARAGWRCSEALAYEFFDTAARLQVLIDSAEAEVYAACVTTFLDAKQLAKEPGSTLGPWVREMEHALRREKGRT